MLSLLEVLARSGSVQLNPPTTFNAVPGGASQVNLTWVRASAGYVTEVYRDGALYFTTAAGAQSYNDTGAASGSAFTYRIRHKSGSSYSSFTAEEIESGTPPAPSIAASVTTDDVNIVWSAVPSATGYEVYRDGSSIGTTSGLTYDDLNLANGTYDYTVKATNGTNQSVASNVQTETVSYAAPLTDPSGLTLVSSFADRVGISWTNGDVTASTEIYRGTSPNPTSLLTTVAAAGTSYNDSSVLAGTLYYYRIRHVKGAQVSSYVEDDITQPTPAFTSLSLSDVGGGVIQLAWSISNPPISPQVSFGGWSDTEGYAAAASLGGAESVLFSPKTLATYENIGTGPSLEVQVSNLRLFNATTLAVYDTVSPTLSFRSTGVIV
jgi:hypothetical protein